MVLCVRRAQGRVEVGASGAVGLGVARREKGAFGYLLSNAFEEVLRHIVAYV